MPENLEFEVQCVLGKRISVSAEYWRKITTLKPPALKGKEELVKEALTSPEQVRESKSDPTVKLYYLSQGRWHICVVVKHKNGDGFIVTGYFTDRIKEGHVIWTKS